MAFNQQAFEENLLAMMAETMTLPNIIVLSVRYGVIGSGVKKYVFFAALVTSDRRIEELQTFYRVIRIS